MVLLRKNRTTPNIRIRKSTIAWIASTCVILAYVYTISSTFHNASLLTSSSPESPAPSDNKNTILNHLINNAAIQSAERDAWFQAARAPHVRHRGENSKLAQLDLSTFYGGVMLQPSAPCPVDLIKTSSVKDIFDGGKWMCGASLLKAKQPCVVYSLGCNFETSFERKIQSLSGGNCDIHVYDPTLNPPKKVQQFKDEMVKERIYLHEIAVQGTTGHSKITIGEQEFEAQGLETIFKANGHDCIDVLKFDVEGAEYDILENTDWCKFSYSHEHYLTVFQFLIYFLSSRRLDY